MPPCCWTDIPRAVILRLSPGDKPYIIPVFPDEEIAARRAEMLGLANDYPEISKNADAISQEFDPNLLSR
jgi:hypothetical protein